MAHRMHTQRQMLANAVRTAATLTLLVTAGSARADCPSKIDDMASTGFLASATRIAMEDGGIPQPHPQVPGLAVEVGAAGGVRADTADAEPTGSVAGMLTAHRGSVTACASGDVVDLRAGAVHATGSLHVPFLFTGLSFGTTIDRDVQLPLSASSAYLRAPLTRTAMQFSASFLDFEMSDEQANHLRTMVMPFAVTQAMSAQDDGMIVLARHETSLETAMFRFAASDAHGTGQLDVFAFASDTAGPSVETQPYGFIRVSPVSVSSKRDVWSFDLDGGWLGLAGPADCHTQRCYRGFYTGALGHAWQTLSLEARAERTGVLTPDNAPAFEDRATATASVDEGDTRVTTSAFAARLADWEGEHVVHRGGVRASVARRLPDGLTGVLDGELAHADAITPATPHDTDARLLVSLAWQKRATR